MSGIKSHVLHGASAVMKASTWPVACASGVYFPGDKNWSKYGFYMGFPASMKGDQAYSWCAAFVSWSARKAGIPTSKIPNYVYVPAGWNWFNSHGRLYLRSELAKTKFRPKPGDIVFFRKGDQHHTGIVATADNSSFSTIGDWYRTHGSHGCVNLPSADAKTLYAQVRVGTKVVIHK